MQDRSVLVAWLRKAPVFSVDFFLVDITRTVEDLKELDVADVIAEG